MASLRSVVLAIAVLAALILAVLPAVQAAPAASATPLAGARPAASDFVYPADQFGGSDYQFQPGTFFGNGQIYFVAYDPVDASATVKLWDQNASRDNLPSPVATWTPKFVGSNYNYSYTWSAFYTLPPTLALGGQWSISINGTTAGNYLQNFTVQTYTVWGAPTEPAYLQDHSGTVAYAVNRTVNNALATTLTAVTVTGYYQTTNGSYRAYPSAPEVLALHAAGTFNFTVPSDANTYSWMYLTIFANSSNYSEQGFVYIPIGHFSAPEVTIDGCFNGCATHLLTAGQAAYVIVRDYIVSPAGSFPSVGLTANFQFFNNQIIVPTVPGSPPGSLSLNASGMAEVLFFANTPAFSTVNPNKVLVTVSDGLNPSANKTNASDSFSVYVGNAAGITVFVQFAQAQYVGGDNANVTWAVGGINASATMGWTGTSWYAYDTSGAVASWGTIPAGTLSGSFSFPVPLNSGGSLSVTVWANNATTATNGGASVLVTQPEILLNAGSEYYLAGNSITVTVQTIGSVFSGATLYGNVIEGSSGGVLWSGTVTGGQIQFTVPSVATPSEIQVSVVAQSGSAGVFSRATIYLYEGSGVDLIVGVSTQSHYADGSFQPGQTISITYTLTPIGRATLPKTWSFYVYPACEICTGASGTRVFESPALSGSFNYQIPSNFQSSVIPFTVYAEGDINCNNCFTYATFSVPVNSHPDALGYELAPGSGLTTGWLVLLIIVIVVALLLWVVLRRKGGRTMVMHPSTDAKASEWKEPPASSGSSSSDSGSSTASVGGSESPPLPPPASS